jgi:hypothetical protein
MALTKVFRIELTGGKDVEKDLTSIKTAMSSMANAIAKAKGELAELVSTKADPGAISSLTAKIADLEAKMKSLGQERKKAQADEKLAADITDKLAAAKLKDAKADRERIKSQIDQEKELDRMIDREKKEQQELQKKKQLLDAEPGSYNAIKKAAQDLYAVLKNSNSGSTLSANGQTFNFDQAIAEYKRLSAAEQDFRRQFTKDGTLVGEYESGIVNAFKQLNIDDIIKNQVNGAKQQLSTLEQKTKDLVVAYRQAQQEGSADLNKLEKEIHDNVVETQNLRKSVAEAEVQLKGVGGVGQQITTSINEGFKNLKNSIAQFALTYVGFFAAFNQFQKSVELNAELSDSFAQLQIFLHGSKQDVDNLVESLKKIPTRTSLQQLVDISTIVAKKGVAKEEIAGVTQALDQLFVVLGKEVGDPHEAIASMVKLVNVYSEDKHVTAKNIGDIGAAIQKLTSSGVATGDFLINFAERLAGVRGITGVSIQNVLGLGAALQELGQRSEVAGTAGSQLIVKLFGDIPKYAGFAGKSVAEFTKTVTENPVEALVQLAAGLKNNKAGLDEVAQAFDQAGIHGARVVGVLGDIAGNADYMRKRIKDANAAFGDQASIVAANEIKQNTFAATLDNIKKKFELLGTSKGFQITLNAIATAILFLINNIPALLALGSLLAVNWSVQNAQLILLNARVIGYNLAIGASYVALGALTVAQAAYNGVMFIANGVITIATRALAFFGITVKATSGPLGVILTVATLLAAAFAAFGRRLEESRGSLSEYIRLQQINAEVSKKAAEATNDQISKIDGWVAVIKSAATSADTKRQALQKLIDINPAFQAVLQGQTIDLQKLDAIYKQVTESIKAKARAEAAASLSAEKQKNIVVAQTLRQRVEVEVAQQKGQTIGLLPDQISDAESQVLRNIKGVDFTRNLFDPTKGSLSFDRKNFDSIIRQLKAKEDEAVGVYQDYLKVQLQAEADLKKLDDSITAPVSGGTAGETVFQIFDRLINNNGTAGDFKELLKKIEAQKKATSVTSEEYKKLLELQKKVQELIKPKSSSGGSHRSPEKEKLDNRLKEIDAAMTEQKNALDQQLADGLISERDYYLRVRDITTNGEQQKIDTIQEFQQKYKKALARFNGELEKDVADATKKQIQAKREANQKLFDIDNKQLEKNLHDEEQAATKERDTALLNPNLSNVQKLKIEEDYQNKLLQSRIVFNQKQIDIEKLYSIKSIDNEKSRKDAIEKILKDLQNLQQQGPEARFKDIQEAADRQLVELRKRVADQTIAILESNSSYTKKARNLAKVEQDATKTQLANEAAAAKIALDQAKIYYDARLISEAEYQKKLEDYKTKEAALYKVTTDEQVSATQRFINALKELKDSFVEGVIGIKKYSNDAVGEQQRVEDATKATQESIKTAVNDAYQNYFKNQDARIDRDKQEQQEALDREKQQVLARADSQAEKDAIDRQYAQKQKEIEKKAAEQKKQNALKQATIDFAVAVTKTFATFGFPLGLLPVAGLTALYLLQRSQIQKQQFAQGGLLKKLKYAFGGKPDEVPVNGGKFGGLPHSQGGTDFEFNGQSYNAEVDELSVIRTKSAPKNKVYTITGNHTQIASALNSIGGGISFSPGATVAKFGMGGALGSQLKAPYFSAGTYLNGGNISGAGNVSADVQELKGMVAQIAGAVYATDAKEVQLNPNKVTRAQKKKIKDTSVGDI